MAVARGGDAERVALLDRLREEIEERGVDARVLDPGGSEEKLHVAVGSNSFQ